MKRTPLSAEQQTAANAESASGRRYWRSLDDLVETPAFKEKLTREFPEQAATLEGVDRRNFLKLMAAGFALGGVGLAAGCRRPEKNILPYGKSVEGIIPGLPSYFASAMPLRRGAIPILAETHQGRPTKIEGNPTYAPYGGATNGIVQASVLDLYDPDRAIEHTQNGNALTVAALADTLAAINKTYSANDGAGLAFLADESSSPTRAVLVAQLRKKFPKAIWSEYEPVNDDTLTYITGDDVNVKPIYHFEKAKRIVSLDSDFLHTGANAIAYTRDFAKGRRVNGKASDMNRLYVVESNFTLTGGMADHRLRVESSNIEGVAITLLNAVLGSDRADTTIGVEQRKWIEACAADLRENKGKSLVIAGPNQPPIVHFIAHVINSQLGNTRVTFDFVTVDEEVSRNKPAPLAELAAAIKSGSVKTLVILNGNPAYNAPADLNWPALQKSVPDVIRLGYYADETTTAGAAASFTHITAAHYLESWGDARTADGTIVPIQPMILPLFDGRTEIEILSRILSLDTTDSYTLVRRTITSIAGATDANAESVFKKFLHDGLLEGSAYKTKVTDFVIDQSLLPKAPTALSAKNLEVRFVPDTKIDDGRFANNGWLQECPEAMTKISWDNPILISPRLGKELGIAPKADGTFQVARTEENEFNIGKESARIAEITLNGRTIRGPVHIQPGLANYTIVLPLGYGRTFGGRVANNTGFSAYALRTSDAPYVATGATIKITDERYKLANTQEHWSMEGRDLVREANLDEYKKDPAYVAAIGMESHTPANYGKDGSPLDDAKRTPAERAALNAQRAKDLPRGGSLYKTPSFTGEHQWGMVIDLNTCIGCTACVIACQAENNIPIVGKDQVLRGREMHWIRLDRYYSDGKADATAFGSGTGNRELPEDPQVSLQPVACAQCETAPCETVCPVNATVHDEEGLNAMAYNRCIGTRYCANNCPYKVRRFNFFDWNKRQLDSLYLGPLGPDGMPELVKMVKNPDVTVRMRGVMEKCTYCVQRIQQAKIKQKVAARDSANVKIPDGTIKVACQQACAADAITFGDISDVNSDVSKARALDQNYSLLGYLNIRPRTTYLGRLRNPNPKMPDYVALPFSRQEYNNKNHPAHHEHGHDEASATHEHKS